MNWDYVAGFFDGEGSMMMTSDRAGQRKSINVQVSFYHSDKHILDLILEFLTSHGICGAVHGRKETSLSPMTRKPIYTLLVCNRRNVELLLTQLLPRIYVKRQRAEDTLRFLKIYPAMVRGRRCDERQAEQYTVGKRKFIGRANSCATMQSWM